MTTDVGALDRLAKVPAARLEAVPPEDLIDARFDVETATRPSRVLVIISTLRPCGPGSGENAGRRWSDSRRGRTVTRSRPGSVPI